VDNDDDASDCDGHGTHVSSTAAGLAVGVAKGARVVAVRVLDCDGVASISTTIAGALALVLGYGALHMCMFAWLQTRSQLLVSLTTAHRHRRINQVKAPLPYFASAANMADIRWHTQCSVAYHC
jgi:hypothetical protein